MFLRKRRRSIAAEVRSRLGENDIIAFDESANFFGVESRGPAQLRGNGCLGASADEVLFIMWLPRRETHIPRAQITGVERTRSHLGKTIGSELLRIRFTNDEGSPDSIAWFVTELPAWESALAS
ncbi:MAG: hypothetical protein ABR505_00445 [Actinomycetota bacterium]